MFKGSINKIIIIFAVLVSIPAIIFSIDEISSLNQTEKIIDQVYNDQLNTILSTVDQFSYDIVYSWTRKINLLVVDSKHRGSEEFDENIKDFLKLNPTVQMIVFSDINHPDETELYSILDDSVLHHLNISKQDIIRSNDRDIKEVLSLHQDSIRRIKPVMLGSDDKEEIFFFPLDYTDDSNDFCGIIINPRTFIKGLLAPEIKTLSQSEFKVSITDNNTDKEILISNGKEIGKIQQKKALTLFPNFAAAIFLKNKTIASLVSERVKRNLLTLFLIDIILFAAVWFLLKNLKKEIELSKIRTDFVANVSHELRTPLSLINIFAETLALNRITNEDKKQEYYKIIHQESSRLGRIVNKILTFYKIEEKKKIYNFQPADLNYIVENILDSYSYNLNNLGFNVSFNKDKELPEINIDEEAVSDIVINLMDNAIKYSAEKKDIIISTGKNEKFVYFKLKDSGIGISAENQKKIFEKFFRVQKNMINNIKGTGLGLTIVKSIMNAHNGEITVESTEGQGSCFTLNFPIKNNI